MHMYDSRHQAEFVACVRCGIRRRVRMRRQRKLCLDCRTVAAQLGELHLWLEPDDKEVA